MNREGITLGKIILVGISVRTNNEKAQREGDIAKLWNDFLSNNILNRIGSKLSDDIYCVYTEYESDFEGDYTTFIGCAVSNVDKLSEDMKSMEIAGHKYLKFVSEGEIPTCVMQTWNHIWSESYTRAYKADFDIYGKEATDFSNAKVTTYLSII